MRCRLFLLSTLFTALFSVAASVSALALTPPETDGVSTSFSEGVCDFSEVVSSHLDRMEEDAQRLDDKARHQRILQRRGRKLPSGWFERQRKLSSRMAPTFASSFEGTVDPRIVTTIQDFNPELSEEAAIKLSGPIQANAARYGVDPLLVTALVSQESGFCQSAVSPVGATGLGQLMPETAAELGVNPKNAGENIDGCVRYLADLLYYWSQSEDPTALALASYNAGAGNVELYGGVPPFEETQNYVAVIKDRYSVLSSGRRIAT